METKPDIRCVAGILVGGRSSRMGRPKATLPRPDGQVLVEHVASVARQTGSWIEEVAVLGHCRGLPASLSNLPVLPDAERGAGPLAGLCSLLKHAGQRWALLLACDMPLISTMLLERLHEAIRADCNAVAFRRSDGAGAWHACCALYHPRLLPVAVRELERGNRSLQRLLGAAQLVTLDPSASDQRALMNVNDREDYEALFHPA